MKNKFYMLLLPILSQKFRKKTSWSIIFSANLLNDSIYQKLSFRFPMGLPDNKEN